MTLPVNFVGIGAAKCATGSIHRYLGQHPDVFVSSIKETNFFIDDAKREHRNRVRSLRAYERQFAGANETAVGEYSPQYMNHPAAARRIAEALPEAKLLVSLRCPADRAYSSWAGRACSGVEGRPAELALRRGNRYVDDGFYRQRLAPFLELFPRERIRIVIFEEFVVDPASSMAGLYRFLGVDPGFKPDVSVRVGSIRYPRHLRVNSAWQALRRLQPHWFSAPKRLVRWNRELLERSLTAPPPYDPALRARLIELYREDVADMEELLGRDLTIWQR